MKRSFRAIKSERLNSILMYKIILALSISTFASSCTSTGGGNKSKICDANHLEDCCILASDLHSKGDKLQAKKYWQLACENKSMRGLGFALESEGKHDLALPLFVRACEAGLMMGCNSLGVFYEENQKEVGRANKLYAKACDGGYLEGCTNLGENEKKNGNLAAANKLLTKACDGNSFPACVSLTSESETPGETQKNEQLYTKACSGGYLPGCVGLGGIALGKKDIIEARRQFKFACDGGEALGCGFLGNVEVQLGNHIEARRLFGIACDDGIAHGCKHLAVEIEDEEGRAAEALALYKKACKADDEEACKWYADLNGGRSISSDENGK
jgi:uncharacterized protein